MSLSFQKLCSLKEIAGELSLCVLEEAQDTKEPHEWVDADW